MRRPGPQFKLLELLMEKPGASPKRGTQLLDGVLGRDVDVDERTRRLPIGLLTKWPVSAAKKKI